jgi:hypothetical protein
MSKKMERTRRNQIRVNLVDRFKEGERFTLKDVVNEFFQVNNEYEALLVKSMSARIIGLVKKDLQKEGFIFGTLDESGTYGIPDNELEFRYMGLRKYRIAKGIIQSTGTLMRQGISQGLIKASEEQVTLLKPLDA